MWLSGRSSMAFLIRRSMTSWRSCRASQSFQGGRDFSPVETKPKRMASRFSLTDLKHMDHHQIPQLGSNNWPPSASETYPAPTFQEKHLVGLREMVRFWWRKRKIHLCRLNPRIKWCRMGKCLVSKLIEDLVGSYAPSLYSQLYIECSFALLSRSGSMS